MRPGELSWRLLKHIMECLSDEYDLMSMMQTCRTLEEHGIPLILRHINLTFPASRMQLAQLRYLHQNLALHSSYIRILTCNNGILFPRPSRSLVQCLENAIQLQHLEISFSEKDSLDGDFVCHFSAFRNLHHIKLVKYYGTALPLGELFDSIDSALKTVSVHTHGAQNESHPFHFISSLAKFSSSLEVIHLDVGVATDFSSKGLCQVVFPQVRELDCKSQGTLDTDVLISTFPNVSVVKLWCHNEHLLLRSMLPLIRHQNQQCQDAYSWASLKDLTGDCVSLWTIGLKCDHVQSVTVQLPTAPGSKLDSASIVEIVSDVHPSHLSICVDALSHKMPLSQEVISLVPSSVKSLKIALYWHTTDESYVRNKLVGVMSMSFLMSDQFLSPQYRRSNFYKRPTTNTCGIYG